MSGRLKEYENWIAWRYEERDGKETKVPVNPYTHRRGDSTDPDTWADYETAVSAAESEDGIGFVFTDTPFAGVDLDKCRDPDTGDLEDWAVDISDRLDSLTEVSPSGTGLHIYVKGEIPDGGNRNGGVEMYDTARFFTFTADFIETFPDAIQDRQDELEAVHAEYVYKESNTERREIDLDVPDPDGEASFTNEYDESLEAIRARDDKLDQLLNSIEPAGYDSASEADMAAATKLHFWRFTPNEIAQIIRRYRRRGKVIDRDDYLELTISKAATGEQYEQEPDLSDDEIADHAHVIDDRREYADIENPANDIDLPAVRSFLIDKPPRSGGSYATILHFIDSGDPFMLISPRHKINDQHTETVAEHAPSDYSIVHLKGKAHHCDGGATCNKIPSDYTEYQNAIDKITSIVRDNQLITPDDAPMGLCKHWFLKNAARFADVVVTVPQIAPQIDRDFSKMRVFIDEEQSYDPFRPGAVDLLTFSMDREPDERITINIQESPIGRELETLEEIEDKINQAQKERAKQGTTDKYKVRPQEADLKRGIEHVRNVAGKLGITSAKESIKSRGDSVTLSVTREEFENRLDEIEPPEIESDPDDLLDEINEYAAPYFFKDSVDPGALLTSVLFPYSDNPFHFKTTNGNVSIRAIGNKERLFNAEFFESFKQVATVAGPEGERILRQTRDDPVVIDIQTFPYAEDYVVIPIGRRLPGDTDDMEPILDQRDRAAGASVHLNKRNMPHIAVVGTKQEADSHNGKMDSWVADKITDPDDPQKYLRVMWSVGGTVTMYQNSVISRGVNVPQMDITVIVSPGFATPYWEAKQDALDPDTDEYKEAQAIEQELKQRELTNAALRSSPTYDRRDQYGTKYILVAHDDVNRIQYLDSRVTPKVTYAKQAAKLLEVLAARGSFEADVRNKAEQLDTRQDFAKAADELEFSENHINRPIYTLSEVEDWIENAYLNDETVNRVIDIIKESGQPKTSEINRRMPGYSSDRIKSILSILERKGRVFSAKGASTGGRPPTIWEVTELGQ